MPSNDPKTPQGRVRDVRLWWTRDDNGPIIADPVPPLGIRTAEGFVWGHKLEHLFWVQRIPRVNAMTIWSRSMLKDFGEGYADVEWDEDLVEPRVVRPWPVLRLPDGHPSPVSPPIGAIDGGCGCEHAEQVMYKIRETELREDADDGTGAPPVGGAQTDAEEAPGENAEKENTKDEDVEMQDAAAGGTDSDASAQSASKSSADGEHPEQAADGTRAANARNKGKQRADSDEAASGRNLFSVDGLPKLEEFIPEEFFPDVLMVHDPDNTTKQREAQKEPIKYIRCYPTFKRDDDSHDGDEGDESETHVAHLHLSESQRFGTGNHSYVYRAPFTPPSPLSAHSPTGQVTVAAKLAYPRCTAHNLLRNEAKVYNTFPRYIQEEYCGYNIVPQCRFPVPATAIVPKFYGYYLPVDERGNVLDNHHEKCSETRPCSVKWPSPVLLMEECGNPVEPSEFTIDQRTECFSLILRLHYLEIVQGSFYVRNIMMQPGPLTVPPEKRSYDTPSFRIIDFGRGQCWDWHIDAAQKRGYWHDRQKLRDEFMSGLSDEIFRARKELLIDDFGF